jgi:hypothetical protein
MNLTLSIPDDILDKSRKVAQQQGISVNEMVRRYLATVAGHGSASKVAEELQTLWSAHPGRSGGKRFRRGDAYEGRL